jgi:hypothetical protein
MKTTMMSMRNCDGGAGQPLKVIKDVAKVQRLVNGRVDTSADLIAPYAFK